MRRILISALIAFLLPAVAVAGDGPFRSSERFHLMAGETHTGDLYLLSGETLIAGRHEGDMMVWTASMRVDGEVTGDLFVGTNNVDIAGTVGDSVRAFAESVTVSGTIEGDLLALGARVTILESAHIKGDIHLYVGIATVSGTVDGNVHTTGGEITLGGPVGGDVTLEVDALQLTSNANLMGDLTYTSRRELEMEAGATIAGETTFKEKIDEEKDRRIFTKWSVGLWIWFTSAALLVGLALLALLRRLAPAIVSSVGAEPFVGTLIGFGAFLVIPAASALAILLIISLPLGVMAFFLYAVALYVAKIPVAVWLGHRLLTLMGNADPSPYLALVLGLPILYGLFTIPFVVGNLVWLTTTWLGLGAIIMATRTHFQSRQSGST